MTENNPETTTEDAGNKSVPAKKTASKKSGSTELTRIHVALLLLVIIIISGGAYLYSRIHVVNQSMQDLAEYTAGNNKAVNDKISALEKNMEQLNAQFQTLNNALTELYQQQPGNNEDWALAEVEYLLIIASHRLLLERDVATALTAMEAAARRLQALGSPDLIPVREQLTADINKLKTVNSVDITGVSIYLADLIERASNLPLKNGVIIGAQESAGPAAQDLEHAGGRGFMNSLWQELKSLVVIKKSGEVKQELLLPGQDYFLYQNLRLELESARLSVLRRDTDNLHSSIALLLDWLEQYFDGSDSGVANVMETLKQMATLKLDPPLPDINSSLETLRAYMRGRENAQSTAGPDPLALAS